MIMPNDMRYPQPKKAAKPDCLPQPDPTLARARAMTQTFLRDMAREADALGKQGHTTAAADVRAVYNATVNAATARLRETETEPANGWRTPSDDDQGGEYLVKSAELVDEDFNPKGICAGSIVTAADGPGRHIATCATWCNHQDHYHTKEIGMPFLIHDIPD